MEVLVVGAPGMTGVRLVEQLLERNHDVHIIVRSVGKLSSAIVNNPKTTIIKAAILDLSDHEMADHVRDIGDTHISQDYTRPGLFRLATQEIGPRLRQHNLACEKLVAVRVGNSVQEKCVCPEFHTITPGQDDGLNLLRSFDTH